MVTCHEALYFPQNFLYFFYIQNPPFSVTQSEFDRKIKDNPKDYFEIMFKGERSGFFSISKESNTFMKNYKNQTLSDTLVTL